MWRISAAARGGSGDIVNVLPLPVWPYAKHVALPILKMVCTRGCTEKR